MEAVVSPYSGATSISVFTALAGGALIGLSASLLLVLDGRVAGISSILGGIVRPQRGDVAWRATFLAGLFAGAGLLAWRIPAAVVPRPSTVPPLAIILAGLVVGFGTP